MGWEKVTVFSGSSGNSTTAASFNGRLYPTPNVRDTLLTWLVDLAGIREAYLTFDVAFALFSTSRRPELSIIASANCGRSFVPTNYAKAKFELATITTTNLDDWQPTRAAHWRRDSVSLAAFRDSVLMLGFVWLPENDNRLYLDNINIDGKRPNATADAPLSMPMLAAFPNPSEGGMFDLSMRNFDTKSLIINIFDGQGKLVFEKKGGQLVGNAVEKLNLKHQPTGIYWLQVQTERRTYGLKLTKL